MNKKTMLFFYLCLGTLASALDEIEKSSEPQIFEIDLTEETPHIPISESDLEKTKIVHRYFHNSVITSQLLASIINVAGCKYLKMSQACSKAYYFKTDKSLARFLHDVKNDSTYAQTFYNTIPGARQAIPAITSYENARESSIIPCVFCPNVNNQPGKYEHAIVFDSDNTAICKSIRAHNKKKNN